MLWERFLPVLNEAFMLSSAACVIAGWAAIRRHRVPLHRALMLTAASLGAAFFVSYLLHSLLVGDTSFGGPASLQSPYLVLLQSHVLLATGAAVMGVITLRRALRGRFAAHRRVAPWTAAAWLVAAGTGLGVYLLLYVVYAPGPTVNWLRDLVHK